MNNTHRIKGIILALCLLAATAGAKDKILLVHSYHEGYPWVDDITASVREGLKGTDVELTVFYMDTKRKPSDEWKVESGKLAEAKMKELQPGAVITVDDNAQEYFAKKYAGKADAPQIIFCGVNAEASQYGYPAENVTGILERAHFVQSIEMLTSLQKDIKKIAVITDKSATSDAIVQYIKTLKPPVQIVSIDQPVTFAKWRAAITRYQTEVDAFGVNLYHTIKRKPNDAESMSPERVIEWTMANNTKPTFGFMDFNVESGVLCALAESGNEHGEEAVKIALECLKGKKAGEFKIRLATKGQVVFNLKTAKKLGIEIPAETLAAADKVFE